MTHPLHDPVMKTEAEIQRAHDLLGMAVTLDSEVHIFRNAKIREQAIDVGLVLCWALGHDGPVGDFGGMLLDIEERLREAGYLKTKDELEELIRQGQGDDRPA